MRLIVRSCLAVLILVLLTCSVVSASEYSASVDSRSPSDPIAVLPFEFDPLLKPFIIVRASIGDHSAMRFIVDTGLTESLIVDTSAAAKLGLKRSGPHTELGAQKLPVTPTSVSRLVVVGAEKRLSLQFTDINSALIADLGAVQASHLGEPVAGIIGIKLLKLFQMRLNFAERTMEVYYDAPALAASEGRTIVPLIAGRDRFLVPVRIGVGQPLRLLLDTGSLGTTVPLELAKKIGANRLSVQGYVTATTFGIAPLALVSLTVGSRAIHGAVVQLRPKAETQHLGLGILAAFDVMLDFPHRLLILDPRKDGGAEPLVIGESIISLSNEDRGFIVEYVETGSAADIAGVRKGDRVVEVDGRRIEGIPLRIAHRLISGIGGAQASLILERGGSLVKATYSRRDEFSGRRRRSFGLMFEKSPLQGLRVTAVLPDSVADEAGIRVGDEIVSIGEHHSDEITPATLPMLLEQDVLVVRLKRKGSAEVKEVQLRAEDSPVH